MYIVASGKARIHIFDKGSEINEIISKNYMSFIGKGAYYKVEVLSKAPLCVWIPSSPHWNSKQSSKATDDYISSLLKNK